MNPPETADVGFRTRVAVRPGFLYLWLKAGGGPSGKGRKRPCRPTKAGNCSQWGQPLGEVAALLIPLLLGAAAMALLLDSGTVHLPPIGSGARSASPPPERVVVSSPAPTGRSTTGRSPSDDAHPRDLCRLRRRWLDRRGPHLADLGRRRFPAALGRGRHKAGTQAVRQHDSWDRHASPPPALAAPAAKPPAPGRALGIRRACTGRARQDWRSAKRRTTPPESREARRARRPEQPAKPEVRHGHDGDGQENNDEARATAAKPEQPRSRTTATGPHGHHRGTCITHIGAGPQGRAATAAPQPRALPARTRP